MLLRKLIFSLVVFFKFFSSFSCDFFNSEYEEYHYRSFDAYENYIYPYIFISLGNDCKVTTYIRKAGLNSYSYPLDWVLSFDCDLVCDLLENSFVDFLNINFLQNLGNYCRTSDYYHVGLGNIIFFNNKFDIEFRHDFTVNKNFEEQYAEICEKYNRRINRLYRALSQTEKKVYLVRKKITKTQALRLKEIINNKFPLLDFTIIALDNSEEMRNQWNIPNIKNFYFDNPTFVYDHTLGNFKQTPLIRNDLWISILPQIIS